MRVVSLAAFGAVTLAACGGGNSGGAGNASGSDSNNSSSGSVVVAAGPSLNPDGFAYPNPPSGYGHTPRVGTTPGSVIQNFKFLGYPNGDPSQGLKTVSLADYYDPCGKRYTLLRLSVAAVWCNPCNEETDAIVADKATLASERVVVIQALSDGMTEGVGATPADLTYWVGKHMSNFTEMLDPGLLNLGSFFVASSVPWNADIDPRTMEILHSATGWSGDLDSDLVPSRMAAAATPDYALSVTCN